MTQARRRKQLDLLPKRNAAFIEPMECLAVSRLPAGAQWVWEIKLDGYRAIAVRSGGAVDLFSRRKKSLSKKFPYIVEALAGLPEGTVVDGELVALDDRGRPEFNLLQNFRGAASRIHYYIFDLLCYEGRDLTRLPLVERRAFRSCSLLPWSCAAIVPLPIVKKITAAQAVHQSAHLHVLPPCCDAVFKLAPTVLYHTSLFHPADTVARKESRCTRVAAGEETGGQDIDAPSFFCLNIQAGMWITSRKRART